MEENEKGILPVCGKREEKMCKKKFVVAFTGASGVAYGVRLVEVLTTSQCDVHLIMTHTAVNLLETEMHLSVDPNNFSPSMLGVANNCDSELFPAGQITFHCCGDYFSPVASGSCGTDGMVVCPCTMGTLGAISSGIATNLVHRAADVHIKEGRKLILVPRETPYSVIHLENMTRLARAGVTILPASPAFYHGVHEVRDLVDFLVSRICDQLGVENTLIRRWREERSEDSGRECLAEMMG